MNTKDRLIWVMVILFSLIFTLSTRIYIEYWGLSSADNETGEKYRARKQEKIELYEKHRYRLMSIYPHHLYELDTYIPDQISILTNTKRGFFARLFALFKGDQENKPLVNHVYCTECGNKVVKGEFCTDCGIKAT